MILEAQISWSRSTICAVLLLLAASPLAAVVLDWDGAVFSEGVLTQTIETDASNPGDDIRISFLVDTDQFIEFNGDESPVVNDTFGDGTSPNPDSLALIVNFLNDTQRVRVQIDFLYEFGVTDLSIPFFDVDVGNDTDGNGLFSFSDQIRRVRTTTDGVQTGNLDLTGLTTLDGTTVDFNGNGTRINGLASTDNDGAGGNFVLDFGDQRIDSIVFDYRNRRGTSEDDPANQGIGIGNISFTPAVPEPNAAWLLGLVALCYVSLRRR